MKKSTIRRNATHRPTPTDHRVTLARRLDLLADVELQHGHHHQAERLAHAAAELRERAL